MVVLSAPAFSGTSVTFAQSVRRSLAALISDFLRTPCSLGRSCTCQKFTPSPIFWAVVSLHVIDLFGVHPSGVSAFHIPGHLLSGVGVGKTRSDAISPRPRRPVVIVMSAYTTQANQVQNVRDAVFPPISVHSLPSRRGVHGAYYLDSQISEAVSCGASRSAPLAHMAKAK